MTTDSNLIPDTCIKMNPGSPNWWLSDDVKLSNTAGPNGGGVAEQGELNDVIITVRRNANCTIDENITQFIKVDLYVCNPTASPMTTMNSKKIKNGPLASASNIKVELTDLPSGGSKQQTIQWDLPAVPTDPAEEAGHKCLIARAYQNYLSGGSQIGEYAGSLDQHYAQRNICIEMCSSPCGVEVWTENPNKEKPQNVKFEVVADTNPSEGVLKVALPMLQEIPGFKKIVTGAPRKGFGLELPDFPDVQKTDNTRPGCLGGIFGGGGAGFTPSFAAEVKLAPSQFSTYRFVTDLDGAESGDAYIFHLMHVEERSILSGLTILMLKK